MHCQSYLGYHKVQFFLFLIHINGVNDVNLSPGSNLVLYADDMLLYAFVVRAYTYYNYAIKLRNH